MPSVDCSNHRFEFARHRSTSSTNWRAVSATAEDDDEDLWSRVVMKCFPHRQDLPRKRNVATRCDRQERKTARSVHARSFCAASSRCRARSLTGTEDTTHQLGHHRDSNAARRRRQPPAQRELRIRSGTLSFVAESSAARDAPLPTIQGGGLQTPVLFHPLNATVSVAFRVHVTVQTSHAVIQPPLLASRALERIRPAVPHAESLRLRVIVSGAER